MGGLLSLLTAALAALMAWQLGRQWSARRRANLLSWAFALLLFAIGAAAQALTQLLGPSEPVYRAWYLSGALLAAAFMGHGSVLLVAGTRVRRILTTLLLAGTLVASAMVAAAPVQLALAVTGGGSMSGAGFPPDVRLLTPFFNVYGTLALVGIAGLSLLRWGWNGGSGRRAAGTGLIGGGALVIAAGGTLTRFGAPELLYVSELAGLACIYAGFRLASSPSPAARPLTRREIARRRLRLAGIGIGAGVSTVTLAIVSLPILPWTMGIVGDVQHVYTAELPAENRGAYLLTDDGVMQLYTWYVQPEEMPDDAPTLEAGRVHGIGVVQKAFSAPDDYQLYELDTGQRVPLGRAAEDGLQMRIDLGRTLAAGSYMLRVPLDSMFGGSSWHYFRIE